MKHIKRNLFNLPYFVFSSMLSRYKIRGKIEDFKIIWHGNEVIAKYAILPNPSSDKSNLIPALVYVNLSSTEYKSVRVILLKNLLKKESKELEDSDLDIHSSLEVGELELSPTYKEDKYGCMVKLYMEFRIPELGVIHVTDNKSILLNLYSSQMMTLMYELYLDYDWGEEYFKVKKSSFISNEGKPDISNN